MTIIRAIRIFLEYMIKTSVIGLLAGKIQYSLCVASSLTSIKILGISFLHENRVFY